MFTWFFQRMLDKFEREWNYDVGYMRSILAEGGPEALIPMNGLTKMQKYRRDVPADVYYTAALLATRHGDCGPCLQLGVKMAQREGVPSETLRAILDGDREAMSDSVRVAYDFTRAVLTRDGWDGAAREELRKRYGPRAIISLSYAIALGGFYPAFKYALGAAHACHKIRIGDLEVIPQPV
jgi:alkylhydroperoxidase family enzyme